MVIASSEQTILETGWTIKDNVQTKNNKKIRIRLVFQIE